MVDLYFPPSSGVCIIAEPGSFFVSSAFTLAVNVISKEVVARDSHDQAHGKPPATAPNSSSCVNPTYFDVLGPPPDEPSPNDEPAFQYFMKEGVYGSFASKLCETQIVAPSVHKVSPRDN